MDPNGVFRQPQKLEFRARNDVRVELTAFSLQVGKARWTPLLWNVIWLRLRSVRLLTRQLGLHLCFWCTFWRITLEKSDGNASIWKKKKEVLLEVVFDWREKSKCAKRGMEIRLWNRLFFSKCWGHVTAVYDDGVFLLSLKQPRVDRWKKKNHKISWQLVLFGFVSLQSCFGLLPLAPSTDQTSATYLLQPFNALDVFGVFWKLLESRDSLYMKMEKPDDTVDGWSHCTVFTRCW